MTVNPFVLHTTVDYSFCRLCLERPGCINIFQNDVLPENIFHVTNVKVCSTDTLPTKLCQNCYNIVQTAVSFRELVSRNNRHLHAYLNNRFNQDNRLLMDKSPEAVEIIIIEEYQDIELNQTPNDCNNETPVITNQSIIKVRNDLFQQQEETPKEVTEETNFAKEISKEKDVENTNYESQDQCHRKTHHSKKRKMNEGTELLSNVTSVEIEKDEVIPSQTIVFEEETILHVAPVEKVQVKEEFKPSKRMKYEDEPRFKCEICSKSYDTSKKLYLHNRLHNKIHVCQVAGCEKKFATRGDLQKHSRTHTGEKPFECNVCKSKFTQKVSLRCHKESIHGMKPENLTDEERVSKVLWGD